MDKERAKVRKDTTPLQILNTASFFMSKNAFTKRRPVSIPTYRALVLITVMTVATDFHRTSLSSANVCKQNRTAKYLIIKSISHTPPFVKSRSENSKKREMTLECRL